ncbi:MAG: ankyrin repeat domain-containing protein [Candidatus Eremiobacteraeota bacterium]|nr:ankyrin repeat domain-containing protein [Candidatus Eremiobacteraeota bacterium]MCW5871975.1 ankyrin repeat domain-containing protein [Candidatus Eremiobacteraeota bacterium]
MGRRPLACAASTGQIKIMEFLLEQGARIDAWCPLRKGVTALDEACFLGQRAAADWLWRRGADPDLALGLNSSPRELREDWFD